MSSHSLNTMRPIQRKTMLPNLLFALVFLALGFVAGRVFRNRFCHGYVEFQFYTNRSEIDGGTFVGEGIDYYTQRYGLALDNTWLGDQLRQIADNLDGGGRRADGQIIVRDPNGEMLQLDPTTGDLLGVVETDDTDDTDADTDYEDA